MKKYLSIQNARIHNLQGVDVHRSQTGYDIRKCVEGGIGMFYKAS